MTLFGKIRLAFRVNPKLTLVAFSAFSILILIISSLVNNYFIKEHISASAHFVGTSPFWERTKENRTEFFFKVYYEYSDRNGKKYDFHFEEGSFDRELAELSLINLDSSKVILWYNKSDPNEIEFKDPRKLASSPIFVVLHFSGFLFFLALLIRTVTRIRNEKFKPGNELQHDMNYDSISADSIAISFRLKIIIQFISIALIGAFFDHSLDWVYIVSWIIISLEMIYDIITNMNGDTKIFDEFNSDLKDQIKATVKRFGEVYEKHFGMEGKGSIHYDAIGAAFGIIVFIYLPFVVLPLLIINTIRFSIDLIILISSLVSSVFGKLLYKPNSTNPLKILSISIYSFILNGLILWLVHLIHQTTLIK